RSRYDLGSGRQVDEVCSFHCDQDGYVDTEVGRDLCRANREATWDSVEYRIG
ncbi:hypothetical protein A2U01_0118226, partial [Trifolium medium]|nr:hypothetical protein [Trifolium medium]